MKETILGIRLFIYIVLSFSTYYVLSLVTNRFLTMDNLFQVFMAISLLASVASRILEEAVFRALKKALASSKE